MFGVWRLEIRVTVIFQVYILWYSYIHIGIATLNSVALARLLSECKAAGRHI